jgi:excisionase family DNA binding protein
MSAESLKAVKVPGEAGFFTVPETVAYLRLSRAKIHAMMENKELAYVKFGKCRRVPRGAVQELVERCLVVR